MPTPVLEIPIDDKDFKAFIETFKKYQDELKNQPAIWDNIGGSVRDSVSVANDFADSLSKQVEAVEKVARAEEHRDRKREDSSRKKRKDRDDEDRDEERASNRRRRAVDQVREYARNIGDIAKKGGSWAVGAAEGALGAVGGGAAGLFGAAGGLLKGIPVVGGLLGGAAMAGYETMSYLNTSRQRAGSLGVSVGSLQGWQDALGPSLPAGSAENLLSTVSQAQATPGQWGLFGRFGIKGNIQNRGVDDLSAEMLTNAQKYMQSHHGAAGWAGANAQFGGAMDTGMLRTLQGMSPKELQGDIANAKKFAAEHKDADKSALKATQDISAAELTASGLVDQFGAKVTSAADQLTTAFKALYQSLGPFINGLKNWQDFKPGSLLDVHSNKEKPIKNDPRGEVFNFGKFAQSGYDSIVGHVMSIAGGVSSLTLGALQGYDSAIRAKARAEGLGNSSAIGQYQIVGTTREQVGKSLWGKDWKNQKFDANHQEQMAAYIWEKYARYGDAHAQFASLPDSRKGAYASFDFDHIRGRLARGEGGLPASDTAHHMAEAVKKGVIQVHHKLSHGTAHVKVKVQQKPGSDVTVSARQLAGH